MHATLELARRLDLAEIDFCTLATASIAAPDAGWIERGGGRAVYAAPGSPVNKVLGLGLGVEVSDEDLDAIEDFYAQRGCPVQIELCPLASPDLPSRLSRRGYVLQSFENELARPAPVEPVRQPAGADIRIEAGADASVWLRVVSEGFATLERAVPGVLPPDAANTIQEMMQQFVHPDAVRYVGWLNGQPAAAALSFITDGALGIFGTATRQEFRRKGLQSAMVARAMNDALGRADVVMATTEPGSTSQRTFERLGFQVVYTRAILVRY
jgi:GNAT superfamily N-acetyltransferase